MIRSMTPHSDISSRVPTPSVITMTVKLSAHKDNMHFQGKSTNGLTLGNSFS